MAEGMEVDTVTASAVVQVLDMVKYTILLTNVNFIATDQVYFGLLEIMRIKWVNIWLWFCIEDIDVKSHQFALIYSP